MDNDINKKQISTSTSELINEEYDVMNFENLNMHDESILSDSLKMYLNEISKYPLLTKEEEKKYANMLRNPKDIKLLLIENVDNYSTYVLNIPVLFNSLSICVSCDGIIDELLLFYGKLSSGNEIVEEKLLNYKKLYQQLGHYLTKDELKRYFNISSTTELFTKKELLIEIKKFMSYKYAFDKIFVSNLRLVVSIARKYHCNMELLDLINEGNLGLMKAIEKYDVSLGYRFSTYAIHWIRQTINRVVINNNNSIRIPEKYYCEMMKFRRNVENLEKTEGRKLSNDELSEKLDIPLKTIDEYNRTFFEYVSLNQPIGDEGDMSILDIVASDGEIDDELVDESIKSEINTIFDYLNEREALVLKMRFGLGEYTDNEMSLSKIAKILSVSTERARQIEYKALFKLKRVAKYDKKIKSLKSYIN